MGFIPSETFIVVRGIVQPNILNTETPVGDKVLSVCRPALPLVEHSAPLFIHQDLCQVRWRLRSSHEGMRKEPPSCSCHMMIGLQSTYQAKKLSLRPASDSESAYSLAEQLCHGMGWSLRSVYNIFLIRLNSVHLGQNPFDPNWDLSLNRVCGARATM